MECPNCHKEVDENVTTCPECGFYISLYQSKDFGFNSTQGNK